MNEKILIFHLDDDQPDLVTLKRELEKIQTAQITVKSFKHPEQLFQALRKPPFPNIVVLDQVLQSGLDGLTVAEAIRKTNQEVVIFIYSNFVSSELVDQARKCGVDDVLSKLSPVHQQADHVIQVYTHGLVESVSKSQKKQKAKRGPKEIVGAHTRRIEMRLSAILNSGLTGGVLISGEKGTGKTFLTELCYLYIPAMTAKSVIRHSVDSILETKEVLAAEGGWLIIDPIEALRKEQQTQLMEHLNNLPDKERFRIIGTTSLSIDALRSSDLHCFELVSYLMSNRISMPPLSERRSDIPDFIEYFLNKLKGGPYTVQNVVKEILNEYEYNNGNIWELENIVSEMGIFVTGGSITAASLPDKVLSWKRKKREFKQRDEPIGPEIRITYDPKNLDFQEIVDRVLKILIDQILLENKKISLRSLSQKLGVSRKLLTGRLAKLHARGLISTAYLSKFEKS